MNRRKFISYFSTGIVSLGVFGVYLNNKKNVSINVAFEGQMTDETIEMPFDMILVDGYFVPKNNDLGPPRKALKTILSLYD